MGKKKRSAPDLEEILARPWCYYCERDFDDLKILINHQKAKHFKCDRCGRRLNTAGGLSVHMTQVHKENLTSIENALPNRAGLEVEIFGMEGIPEDVVIAHRQRVATQFVQAGNQPINHNVNPAAGGSGPNPAKKAKLEAGSDLKARLAAHKAKKAAEEAAAANGGSPAVDSPVTEQQSIPQQQQSVGGPAPGFTPPQFNAPFSGPPGSMPMTAGPGYNGFASPAYGQQPPIQAPQTYGSPPVPFGQQQFQPPPFQPPPFQGPLSAYAPPAQYHAGPTNGMSQPLIAKTSTPPSMLQTPRPSSLPPAPGLPQRPAFGAPPVNAFQLQQMHQGHLPAQMPHADQGKPLNGFPATNGFAPPPAMQQLPQQIPLPQALPQQPLPAQPLPAPVVSEQPAKEEVKVLEGTAEKKSKKDKDKDVKLVYSDNDISPEEKLAKLPRYAFDPSSREVTTVSAVTA